jgi:repressor LexA
MTWLAEEWQAEGTTPIPLLGEVAAGQPLEVFSVEETLDVPESLWKGRKVFALRVRGRSMIDAGIRDGDYLIVEPCESAADGRTVVAEIDGHVTVKRIYREPNGQVRLQPANPEMLPLVVRGDGVRVRGVVVGVLRKYGFRDLGEAAPLPSRRRREGPAGSAERRGCERDVTTLDLAWNAIDAQLERGRAALEAGDLTPRGRDRLVELLRDLQALREWAGRTSKVGLRRALIADAARLVQRMQRILGARQGIPSDATLH